MNSGLIRGRGEGQSECDVMVIFFLWGDETGMCVIPLVWKMTNDETVGTGFSDFLIARVVRVVRVGVSEG